MITGFRVFLSAVTSEFGAARDALANDLHARDVQVRVQRHPHAERQRCDQRQRDRDLVGKRHQEIEERGRTRTWAAKADRQLTVRSGFHFDEFVALKRRRYARQLRREATAADSGPLLISVVLDDAHHLRALGGIIDLGRSRSVESRLYIEFVPAMDLYLASSAESTTFQN